MNIKNFNETKQKPPIIIEIDDIKRGTVFSGTITYFSEEQAILSGGLYFKTDSGFVILYPSKFDINNVYYCYEHIEEFCKVLNFKEFKNATLTV